MIFKIKYEKHTIRNTLPKLYFWCNTPKIRLSKNILPMYSTNRNANLSLSWSGIKIKLIPSLNKHCPVRDIRPIFRRTTKAISIPIFQLFQFFQKIIMSPVAVALPDHMTSFLWTNHASNPSLQYARENVILFRAIGGKDSNFSNTSKFLTNFFFKNRIMEMSPELTYKIKRESQWRNTYASYIKIFIYSMQLPKFPELITCPVFLPHIVSNNYVVLDCYFINKSIII